MICNLTVKRITYFLIIRQLRFDKYEDVAMELERSYFNCLRNQSDTLSDLLPSNELERLVFSNYISSQLLSSVQSSLVDMTGSSSVKSTLRKPKQEISTDESFLVYQDALSIPLKPPTSGINLFSACVSSIARPSKDRKRGRSSESLQMINARPAKSLSDQISNELQEISAELRSNCPSPQAKVNSFLSLAKNDVQNEANLSDVNDGIPPSRTDSCSEHIASENPQFRQLPCSYTQYEISGLAMKAKPLSNTHTLRAGTLSPIPCLTLKDSPFLNDCKTTLRNSKFGDFDSLGDSESCPKSTCQSQTDVEDNAKTKEELPATKIEKTESLCCTTSKCLNGFVDPIIGEKSYTKSLKTIGSISFCSSTSTPSLHHSGSQCPSTHVKSSSTSSRDKRVVQYTVKVGDHLVEACDNRIFHNLQKSDKISILEILRGSCLLSSTFRRKVKKKFPLAANCPLGDILYALFGKNISEYITFNTNPKGNLQLKLKAGWTAEDIIKLCFENTTPALQAALKPGIAFSVKVGSHTVEACVCNSLKCRLEYDDKIKILKILSEGWKAQATFKKRVRQEVPCVTLVFRRLTFFFVRQQHHKLRYSRN